MLNINPVVDVKVTVGFGARATTVFDIGAILTPETGTGTVLSKTNRFVTYKSLSEVLNGVTSTKPAFADTTATYAAAAKYFGVSPAPKALTVIFFATGENETETPVTALADAIDKGAEFYGLYYIPKASETDANKKTYIIGIASALEELNRGMLFYGVTGTPSSVVASGSIAYALNGTTRRALGLYCSSAENDAAALMGVAMGLSSQNLESAFQLCYKPVATATVVDISQTQLDGLKAVNLNAVVARTKSGGRVETGASASGMRFDEVLYVDRIVKEIQDSLYDMVANSPAKMPQTDPTSTLFLGEIYRILENYYNYGVLADNPWRGPDVGTIKTGDTVSHGYAGFVDSFDTQSAEDRAAHKAMPIRLILCLSGSVESIVINLDVQT